MEALSHNLSDVATVNTYQIDSAATSVISSIYPVVLPSHLELDARTIR